MSILQYLKKPTPEQVNINADLIEGNSADLERDDSIAHTDVVVSRNPCDKKPNSMDGDVASNVKPCDPCHITDAARLPVYACGGRKWHFNTEWYSTFPWLHWQDGKLLCYQCSSAVQTPGLVLTKRVEEAFSRTGVAFTWKNALEMFRKHSRSQGHLEVLEKVVLMKAKPSVFCQVDKQHITDQVDAKIALKAIATTLLTLAQTGSTIRGHDDDTGNFCAWIQTRSEDIPQLKKFVQKRQSFTSHDIQNELMQLMANDVLRQILTEIKKSPYFSIIVDETTDVSTSEQVSICARFLQSELKPCEKFLGMYEVNSTTGEVLTGVIVDALQRFNLPMNKLRGQCYDGASNMAGAFRGVQARIKELQPGALYVHCNAHSLNLALQETTCEVAIVRDSLQYLNDAAVLFGKSAKRKGILEQAEGRIKSLCPTRWTMRSAGIEVALQNYRAILEALEEVASQPGRDDSRAKARGLLEQFNSCRMYWALCVARHIFKATEKLSTLLQSATMTVNGALSAVKVTHDLLIEQRSDAYFEEVMQVVSSGEEKFHLDPLTAPRTRRPPKRHDDGGDTVEMTVRSYYRQQYFQLFDVVTMCLRERFLENDNLRLYSELEELILGKKVLCENLLDVYGSAFVSDVNFSDLGVELKMIDISKVNGTMPTFDCLATMVKILLERPSEVRMLFPETIKLINLLLVVPATSATAERSFSSLRRLKTWQNSTIAQSRLNSVAVLHCYREMRPDLDKVLSDFVGLNELRRRIFGM